MEKKKEKKASQRPRSSVVDRGKQKEKEEKEVRVLMKKKKCAVHTQYKISEEIYGKKKNNNNKSFTDTL